MDDMPEANICKMLHELEFNQVELEMQNEELRHVRAELDEFRVKYSDLYDFAPAGYLTFDKNGLIVEANLTVAGFLVIERNRLVNKSLLQFISKDSQDVFHMHTRNVFDNAGPRTCEIRLRKNDGAEIDVQIKSLMVKSSRGVKLCRSSLVDITERRKAEAYVLQSARLASLGELAAGVAHEISNPVNGIINYAQMLSNKIKPGAEEHDIACRIIKESDRIAAIVKNLLTYAREENEGKQCINIQQIVSEALSLYHSHLMKDGINIEVNIPVTLPSIIIRPQQITQVFLNIISNSLYALNRKHQGKVKDKIIRITGEEIIVDYMPYIKLEFFDNGTGIPAGIIDKINGPFFTTKPIGEGTGLGLSISHSIINNHCGKFTFSSIEGEYTKVNIVLPLLPH